MGKRVSGASNVDNHHHHHRELTSPPARSIRKRKRISLNVAAAASVGKALRLGNSNNSNYWHENDDEDSSSNDATITPPAQQLLGRNGQSTKQANNSSILLNTSLGTVLDSSLNESPKPVYTLMPSVVNGTILHDLTQKPWRLGRPIGKGNFGEIFLASNNITVPVTNENAKFVVKIEPHSNGPLFVEIHCLINTAKKNVDDANNKTQVGTQASAAVAAALSQNPPSGIPDYIASGSHYFGDARYRFLVLQRFDRDLHSLIRNCRVSQKSVLTLAIQIVNVLENLHDKGYCHNDVKAQNLMISKCKYYKKEKRTTTNATMNGANGIKGKSGGTTKDKYSVDHDYEKQQTTDSGNSSEQDGANDEDDDDDEEDARDFVIKSKTRKYNKYKNDDDDDDEDFDDGATSQSNNSNSMDIYETPVNNNRKRRQRTNVVEYSGSNPVRSCRRQQRNSTYEEMVKSHYLRPTKRISYSEFFNEETTMKGSDMPGMHLMSSDDESEEFLPQGTRRTTFSKNKSLSSSKSSIKRLTRRQEKLAAKQQQPQQNNHQQTTTPAISTRMVAVEEERIFLIDFGLASKFMDNGVHRPFVMDQRRAHDGTLEFTSRDAHMGAHSRRSDLECLGYNLVYWSQGFLPWKDAAMQHQQEKVHRAKEYLMTDVREMLKQIYGKQVPKYLGEFLHHVGQLAYHERPDYARYRRLFENEYQQLGYALEDMHLDGNEIMRTCVRFKEEIENKKDIFEMNKLNVLSIMKNLTTVGTPFQESTLSNRVSPKNLRSKSTKKGTKKKKFSWAEILSQDPDQIARERAEKEFDREEESCDMQHPRVRRYTGKPTYAILEVQRRMRMNGRMIENHDEEEEEQRQQQHKQQQKKRVYDDTVKQEDDEHDEDDDDDDAEEEEEEEEEEENSDSDNAEDNYSQKEDEDTETDASEVSDQTPQNYGRSKRMAKCVTTTRKTSKTTNTRATATVGRKRMPATTNNSNTSTTTTNDDSSMKTRTRSCTAVTNKTSVISAAFGKRGGCATRGYGRSVINVASAAGEEHNNAAKYHHYDTSNGTSAAAYERPVVERRTRRCLIKTDAADEVTRDGDESNSNLSPDMHGLFNVWKKINNESIYFKGRAAASASAKHFKK